MKSVAFAFEEVLYELHGEITYCYFPQTAVLSALAVMEDGAAIEAATVGNEGLVGHTAIVGAPLSPNKVIVQIAGIGRRLEIETLRNEMAKSLPLKNLMFGYNNAYLIQMSQSVACNGLHNIEQRCCRWLLMTRDRVGSDELRLTHEYLGVMLGVRRASVSEVLKPLQDAKLLRSHWGTITILDRKGLENLACECYRVVNREYDQLLTRANG